MEYIVYKRYKKRGIGGYFNLPFGTTVMESGGFLHAPDGRCICAATSEDGWCHFRPNTPEGSYRQAMLDELYRYYGSAQGEAAADFAEDKWKDAQNLYWKNLLRTMPTERLESFYCAKFGKTLNSEEVLSCIK